MSGCCICGSQFALHNVEIWKTQHGWFTTKAGDSVCPRCTSEAIELGARPIVEKCIQIYRDAIRIPVKKENPPLDSDPEPEPA